VSINIGGAALYCADAGIESKMLQAALFTACGCVGWVFAGSTLTGVGDEKMEQARVVARTTAMASITV